MSYEFSQSKSGIDKMIQYFHDLKLELHWRGLAASACWAKLGLPGGVQEDLKIQILA